MGCGFPASTIISTKTGYYASLLTAIEQKWQSLNPDVPFEYSFLDEDLQQQYEAEANLSHIISLFTFLAIVISCMMGVICVRSRRPCSLP